MRNLIVIAIAVILLGAGYYGYWNKKAAAFQEMFAQSVDSVNQAAKPYTKDLSLFRYDSATITGFPFSMVLEITKPVADVPVSAFISQTPAYRGMAANPSPFEWVEEISYGDKITLTGNIMGDHFTVTAHGDRTNKTLVNRTARHTLVNSSQAPFTCNLGVERPAGGSPWTMQPIFTDLKTFLAIFRSFDCKTENDVLKDSGGAELLSSDLASFSASNEMSDGTNHKIAIQADSRNTKATPAFDKVANDYMLMYYTLLGHPDQAAAAIPASEAGEQNAKIDIRYDGPTDMNSFNDPSAHFHFDINNFDLSNELSAMNLEVHAANVSQGTDRSLTFELHDKMHVTEREDQLLQARFAAMLDSMAKHPNPGETDPLRQILQKLATLGSPAQVVAKLYPQFHTFGKAALDIDLKVKGPNEDAKFLRHGVITLDDFNLILDPYSIKVKGTSNGMALGGAAPNADFSLTCGSCDALLGDLGNYLMRVEWAFNQFSTPPKPQQITTGLITGFSQFIHGISENPNSRDAVIHLVAKDSNFTISSKRIPEVISLYMSAVAPYLPKPQPAHIPPAPAPGMESQ